MFVGIIDFLVNLKLQANPVWGWGVTTVRISLCPPPPLQKSSMLSNIFLIVNAFTDHKCKLFLSDTYQNNKKQRTYCFLISGSGPGYHNVTHCLNTANSANAIHCPHTGLMLVHRLCRKPNIKPALGQCNVFAGKCFGPMFHLPLTLILYPFQENNLLTQAHR